MSMAISAGIPHHGIDGSCLPRAASAAVRRLSGIISSNDGLLAASSFGTLAANNPLLPVADSGRVSAVQRNRPFAAEAKSDPWQSKMTT